MLPAILSYTRQAVFLCIVKALSDKYSDLLSSAYDRLANKELNALANLNIDPIRGALDGAISDSSRIA
jgi:hypothetical protein